MSMKESEVEREHVPALHLISGHLCASSTPPPVYCITLTVVLYNVRVVQYLTAELSWLIYTSMRVRLGGAASADRVTRPEGGALDRTLDTLTEAVRADATAFRSCVYFGLTGWRWRRHPNKGKIIEAP